LTLSRCSGECTFLTELRHDNYTNITIDFDLTFSDSVYEQDLIDLYNSLGVKYTDASDPILLVNLFEPILKNMQITPMLRLCDDPK